ncbi:hypothetical protein V502_07683 [Pseudogymnoascus sp. VKM F-4520 (FW-2644)]|nr:hypothetical protein V502_07683 [Pseudogymnoascus sp. VKM F-4520 (FW-2644)]
MRARRIKNGGVSRKTPGPSATILRSPQKKVVVSRANKKISIKRKSEGQTKSKSNSKSNHQLPSLLKKGSDLSSNAERAQLAPRHRIEEGGDLIRRQARGEGGVIAQLLDVGRAIRAIEDNRQLERATRRARKVIRATTRRVGVEGRLAPIIPRDEHFCDIKLSASASPARARRLAVLKGARDLSIQQPHGGHVGVEARGGVGGHAEFEEEDLVCAVEAVVGYGSRARVAAAVARDALGVGEDGEFLVAGDEGVGEDGGGGGAAGALGVEVGEGVAEDVVEDAGAVAAVVAEEGQPVELLGCGVVVPAARVGGVGVGGLLLLGGGGCDDGGGGGAGLGLGGDNIGDSSGGGGGGSGDGAAGAEVVVLPGNDLAVNGGSHGISALLVGLLDGTGVEGLVAVAAVGVGVALCGGGGLGVGGDLLEGDWAAEVEGDLLVEGGEGSRVGDGRAGALAVGAHRGHLVVGAGVADVGVLDGVDELAEVVAAIEGGAGRALVGDGGGGSKGQDEGGDAHGEMHLGWLFRGLLLLLFSFCS